MKSRRWTTKEVAAALGRTTDSVTGYMNNRGHSAKEGMTIGMICEYINTGKRGKGMELTEEEINNVNDLVTVLRLIDYGEAVKRV